MYSLSEVADFSVLWHTVSVAQALCGGPTAERRSLRLSATLGIESLIVNGLLKRLVRRQRPDILTERPHHLRQPLTSSFPSGHASAAFCAATLLSDGASRPARLGWHLLAAATAWSRVHVGIHHASDVVGGVVVGWAIGRAARRWWRIP
jgi:undecaprenyl-diphosphatase